MQKLSTSLDAAYCLHRQTATPSLLNQATFIRLAQYILVRRCKRWQTRDVSIETKMMRTSEFRPEIAGLRAIAVLAVVFCHIKLGPFAGGFVGVDVFFVISGYLITRNILRDLDRGTFSILSFYLGRAKRILPALIFTVLATFIIGALWLAPEPFRILAKDATRALLSIANIQYWRESTEYFATTAEQRSMLHFWSLSLEEQFYFIWPAFLLFIVRYFGFARLVIFIVIAGLISFCSSLLMMQTDLQGAFFLMPFRIYEFSIGALIIFAERNGHSQNAARTLVSVAGLFAIGAASVSFADTNNFPGVKALVPALGAAAVIWAGDIPFTSWLICNRFARWVGAISYSLYLCHWPVLFFVRYIFGPEFISQPAIAVVTITMFAFAAAIHRFIEQPFRNMGASRITTYEKSSGLLIYAGIISIALAVTYTAYRMDGWPSRLSASQIKRASLLRFGMEPCKVPAEPCVFGRLDGKRGIELVGDSTAHQFVSAFDPIFKQMGIQGQTSTANGCPILLGVTLTDNSRDFCLRARDIALSRLQSTNYDIIFSQAWDYYSGMKLASDDDRPDLPLSRAGSLAKLEGSLIATFALLTKSGRRILLLGSHLTTSCMIDTARLQPGPLWHAQELPCPAKNRSDFDIESLDFNQMLQRVAARWPDQVVFLNPADFLCEDQCLVSNGGMSLYFDFSHLTVAGARFFASRAAPALTRFLNK